MINEGMIIKLLATCQGPSRRNHIKFVMALTGAPFQDCFAIIGQNPVCLTLSLFYADNIVTFYYLF